MRRVLLLFLSLALLLLAGLAAGQGVPPDPVTPPPVLAPTPARVAQAPDENMGEIYAAIWSSDSRRILSVSEDGVIRVWDAETGELQLSFPGHNDGRVRGEWSPDDTRIFTASASNAGRLWDAQTGELLATLQHDDIVTRGRWSPDGTRIATTSADGMAAVWDGFTGERQLTLEGHTAYANNVAWSPDGTKLATAAEDGVPRVWDAQMGELLFRLIGHQQSEEHLMINSIPNILSVSWSPDGTRLVSMSDGREAIIWDSSTGELLHRLSNPGQFVFLTQWRKDGTHALVAAMDGTVTLWDMTTGTEIGSLSGHTDYNTWVEWSPDESHILTSNFDGTARVWDAETGVLLMTLFHNAGVYGTMWSPDGTRILTHGTDGTIRLWDAETGAELPFLFPTIEPDAEVVVTPVGASIDLTTQAMFTEVAVTIVADIDMDDVGAAVVGEQTGQLTLMNGHNWTYSGSAGEALTVRATAHQPNAFLILQVYAPDGTMLIASDPTINSTAPEVSIESLPADGEYILRIYDFIGGYEGEYTLTVESE